MPKGLKGLKAERPKVIKGIKAYRQSNTGNLDHGHKPRV